jgi:hypothetical protein
MELNFSTEAGTELEGELAYVDADHAFRFEPASPADLGDLVGELGLTSLALDTLQIEVDIGSGRALFVWGLHPRSQWNASHLPRPRFNTGRVQVSCFPGLQRGVTIEIPSTSSWSTIYDSETGWVRIGPVGLSEDSELVLIATDTLLGLGDGCLTSVWLNPHIYEVSEAT